MRAREWRARLHRYVLALRRRWWLVLLSLAVVGGAAGLYVASRPPEYRSQAMMYMTGKMSLPDLPAGAAYPDEMNNYLDTQAQLLKSQVVQGRALERVRAEFPHITAPAPEGAEGEIPFDLKVRGFSRGAVLELSALGADPGATRTFLDAVMEEYRAFKRDARQQTSGSALASITDQIRAVEQQMQQQQGQIAAFQQTNNVVYLTERGASAGNHLAKIEEELSDLRTQRQIVGELLSPQNAALRQSRSAGLGNLVPDKKLVPEEASQRGLGSEPYYYQTLQQIALFKARRADFAAYLRPNHSKMVQFDQQIAALENLLNTLKREDEKETTERLTSLNRSLGLRLKDLEAEHRQWEADALAASGTMAQYNRLNQDLSRSQALYDRLLNLVQTVDLTKNLDYDPLNVLATASLAQPTNTNLKLTAGSVVLALFVGIGLVLLVESTNDRFHSARELSAQLPEQATVGQIPEVPALGRHQGRLRAPGQRQSRDAFAEAFRSLRSSLLFGFEAAQQPKLILVTSALPEEGKTTVAANLAGTVARGGARVLLIDADLRRSSLHRVFGVERKPGLCEVLSQNLPLAQAVVRVPDPASAGAGSEGWNLSLLPAGGTPSNCSELFLCCPMDRLLREVAGQYDYVVIDSAPVLATDEATTLGPKADGVFLVVRAFHTSAIAVREALGRLQQRHVKVLGLIYNRAAPSSDYFYQYSRKYPNHQSDQTLLPVPA